MRAGLIVAGISVLAGLPLGALYEAIVPRVVLVANPDSSIYQVFPEDKTSISQDGYFALIGACAGLVLGVALYVVFRRTPLGTVLGLAVGGVLGSLVMWGFAILLGSESLTDLLRSVKPGVDFNAPLQADGLNLPVPPLAKGVLAIWPLVAALVCLVISAGVAAAHDPDHIGDGHAPNGHAPDDAASPALPGAADWGAEHPSEPAPDDPAYPPDEQRSSVEESPSAAGRADEVDRREGR